MQDITSLDIRDITAHIRAVKGPKALDVYIKPNAEQAKVHHETKHTVFSVLDAQCDTIGSGYVVEMIGVNALIRFIVFDEVYEALVSWPCVEMVRGKAL